MRNGGIREGLERNTDGGAGRDEMRRVETGPLRHRSATRKQERTNERASDRGRLTARIVGGFPSSLFPFFFFSFFRSPVRSVGGSEWSGPEGWITRRRRQGRERALISAAASCRYFRVVLRDKNIFAGRLSFVGANVT